MAKCLAKLKEKFPKFKKRESKKKAKEDIQFFLDNKEDFEFFVKYAPVIKKLVLSVGDREIENLNKAKPCKYREKSEIPFRCNCALKIDGEKEKKIRQCEECKFEEQ